MQGWQSRTAMILGEDSIRVLARSKIAVFGLGGVGSYAVEALARAGVGSLTLVDGDVFAPSNINRQLYALPSTVGMAKGDAAAERVAQINPECNVRAVNAFITPEAVGEFTLGEYDYVLDCIDSVPDKLALICECTTLGTPIISAMGAGNKLHPELFEVADISKTSVCPLARIIRRELRARGINHLKVVYSKEQPILDRDADGDDSPNRRVPGSVSFTPSVMGLIMAGEVIRSILSLQ